MDWRSIPELRGLVATPVVREVLRRDAVETAGPLLEPAAIVIDVVDMVFGRFGTEGAGGGRHVDDRTRSARESDDGLAAPATESVR